MSINFTNLPPLTLYIHMPWCLKKCPYCDFNSHSLKNKIPEYEYINCLLLDLEYSLPLIWGRSIQSIFIGGGTPSLFSGNAIKLLISELRSRLNINPYAEITMEVNPSSVEVKFIAEYYEAGINRISIGIQSFNSQHLHTLGRLHNAEEAIDAVQHVKQFFNNINLDIMYGLPNQTIDELKQDIKIAVSLQPQHLSFYNLTIEPHTYFYHNIPKNLPDNDLCYSMQEIIKNKLKLNSYNRYETSAFAKDGYQTQHNLNYWLFGDYLGIGAGSSSKLTFCDRIIRYDRYKQPTDYMQRTLNNTHIIHQNEIKLNQLPIEFLMNTLRLTDGFLTKLFTMRTSLSLNVILEKLQLAEKKKLIKISQEYIYPTTLGQDFLNDLLMIFLD